MTATVGADQDGLFRPVWAGGWALSRVLFGATMLWEQGRQLIQLVDHLRHPGVNFGVGWLHVWDHVVLPPTVAWAVWATGLACLVKLIHGGRGTRLAVLAWLVTQGVFVTGLGLEINAPEKTMWWVATGFLFGPVDERGLTSKWRSPFGRWYWLLHLTAAYGMNGLVKALEEPGWWTGDVLAYAMVDRYFGGTPWGAWASGHASVPMGLSWLTLAFECAFPFLVWFRATNPLALALAFCFHAGVASLMNVGTLAPALVSTYAVCLDPEKARRIWLWYAARRGGSRREAA